MYSKCIQELKMKFKIHYQMPANEHLDKLDSLWEINRRVLLQ